MTSSKKHIQIAYESFNGAEACFVNKTSPRGVNTAKSLCLAVEHALKAMIVNETNENAPRGHDLTYFVNTHLHNINFDKHMDIIHSMDGLYTATRYDPDIVVDNLGNKMTKTKNFLEFAKAKIESKH